MTEEKKSGPEHPQEADPLSATAMFSRAGDQKPDKPKSEPAQAEQVPGPVSEIFSRSAGRESRETAPAVSSGAGEFTEFFRAPTPSGSTAEQHVSAKATSAPQPSPRSDLPSQDNARPEQGEFTRLFVKGSTPPSNPIAAKKDLSPEPPPAASRTPSQGFSSPGVSDAVSGETGFTQFFKPKTAPAGAESGPAADPVFRSSALSAESSRLESVSAAPRAEPGSFQHESQSVTSFIESLSRQPAARAPEPIPYSAEGPKSHIPAAKPAESSEFESGGVTQFIQRLANNPLPPVEAPPQQPVVSPNLGPGEYTRIISTPTPKPVPQQPAPAAPPAAASVTPISIPPMPAAPAVPPLAARSPAVPAPSVQTAHLPPMPAPQAPPMTAPPVASAPKSKLEAIVPMLLVINTFLMVVNLVVLIFLIKSR